MKKQVALITYTLPYAEKIHQSAPDLILSCTVRNLKELNRLEQSSIDLTKVIAFGGTKQVKKALYKSLHEKEIYCILGTLGNLDRQAEKKGTQLYKQWTLEGADILATDRPVEANTILNP